jgi:hypothetical protein
LKTAPAIAILLVVATQALAQQQGPSPSQNREGQNREGQNLEGQNLEGHAAVDRLIGNTMTGISDGVPYFAYYESGGTVKMQRGKEVASGQWSRDGESLCEEFPDDDDETCYTIKLDPDGMKGTMTDADGTQYGIEILPGNPQKL